MTLAGHSVTSSALDSEVLEKLGTQLYWNHSFSLARTTTIDWVLAADPRTYTTVPRDLRDLQMGLAIRFELNLSAAALSPGWPCKHTRTAEDARQTT